MEVNGKRLMDDAALINLGNRTVPDTYLEDIQEDIRA